MKIKNVILETTDTFEIGKSYEVSDDGREHFLTDFSRRTTDFWFVQSPMDILRTIGVTCTDPKRAESITNMFDGDITGFYYLAGANISGSEEPLKWLLGALAAHMNEHSLSFKKINSVLPADYLRAFCAYLEAKKFDRTFAKDIFAELLKADRDVEVFGDGFDKQVVYEHPDMNDGRATIVGTTIEVAGLCARIEANRETQGDFLFTEEQIMHAFVWLAARDDVGFFMTHRRTGEQILDKIIADPRFKAADESVIDQIVADVLAANEIQVQKAKTDPRVIQWFVGQVMKASKGKASAPVVLEKLRALLT